MMNVLRKGLLPGFYLISAFYFTNKAQAQDFNGLWTGSCQKADLVSGKPLIEIDTEQDWSRLSVTLSKGKNCSDEDAVVEVDMQIDAWREVDVGAYDIDLHVVSAVLTPKTGVATFLLNMRRFCGFNNWKVNQSKDVSGLVCEGVDVPTFGDVTMSINVEDSDKAYAMVSEVPQWSGIDLLKVSLP